MNYDSDPEVPCRNCVEQAKTIERLKALVDKLQQESDLYVKGDPCSGNVIVVGGPRHPLDMD